MYDTAKKAREALKGKARRLASEKYEKVSSADWSPSEPLNADVKTGARPVSRRAYKSGGSVEGSCGKVRADRKPRKAGGKVDSEKAEAKQIAIAKMNRNVKEANEQREGIKHVGGFKKGGRAEKAGGGDVDLASLAGLRSVFKTKPAISQLADAMKKGGRAGKMNGGLSVNGERVVSPTAPKPTMPAKPAAPSEKPESKPMTPAQEAAAKRAMEEQVQKAREAQPTRRKDGGRTEKKDGGDVDIASLVGLRPVFKTKPAISQLADNMKSGGRTKKMMGGPMMGGMDPRMGMVKDRALDFGGQGITPGVSAMKKGGKVEKHADEAMDKALIKKMVKAEARTAKKEGGKVHSDEAMDKALIKKMVKPEARKGKAGGGMLEESKRALMVAKDPHNQAKIRPQAPAPKPEDKKDDRVARKDGGKVKSKGKTQINIMIAAGAKPGDDQAAMMAPPSASGGMPVPVPPPPGPAPAAMPIPMPMPMHGGAGGPPPAMGGGMPPMPRKAGGRVTKKASSSKDMEAGAGSGEGRLQKTDMAAKLPKPGLKRGVIESDNKGYPNKVNGAIGGRTARASGGKTYRSYKDMDAGAGSGKGRLEKTEIEARKS